MRLMSRSLAPLGLLAGVLLLAGPALASDGTCESDADCLPGEFCMPGPMDPDGNGAPFGYCESEDWSDWSDWSDWWTPCDSNDDCADGEYCLDVGDYSECVPDWLVECTTDADCGPGLGCIDVDMLDDWSDWTSGWTDDDWGWTSDTEWGEPMPEPGRAPKRSVSGSGLYLCLPLWIDQGECSSDADCQEGFACALYEVCSCPGWSGPPSSGSEWGGDGMDSSEPPRTPFRFGDEEGCTCAPADTGWCEVEEVACSSDADCALAGWTCEEEYAGDSVCGIDSDGNTWCDEPSDVSTVCLPPYYNDFHGGGGGFGEGAPPRPGAGDGPGGRPGDGTAAAGSGSDETAAGSAGEADTAGDGDTQPAPGMTELPDDGADGPGTPGPDGPGTDAPGTDGPGADGGDGTQRPDRTSSGCSAAPGAPGSLPSALGLLMLLGLVRRGRVARR